MKMHQRTQLHMMHTLWPIPKVQWRCISNANADGAHNLVQTINSIRKHQQPQWQVVRPFWPSQKHYGMAPANAGAPGAYKPIQSKSPLGVHQQTQMYMVHTLAPYKSPLKLHQYRRCRWCI